MMLPDVNVLVYAFRKRSSHHSICRPWLNAVVLGDAQFGISRLTLSALVRITTSRRIFREPSTPEDAFGFCEDLLGQPHCQVVEPGERHWRIFQRLCTEADVRGPMVTDAYYAALAIEWGCEWVTLDRDYARFPGLKWSLPQLPG
jgi:hypothetical protein